MNEYIYIYILIKRNQHDLAIPTYYNTTQNIVFLFIYLFIFFFPLLSLIQQTSGKQASSFKKR